MNYSLCVPHKSPLFTSIGSLAVRKMRFVKSLLGLIATEIGLDLDNPSRLCNTSALGSARHIHLQIYSAYPYANYLRNNKSRDCIHLPRRIWSGSRVRIG